MTGNVLLDLAISIAGVALLVGLARLIFGGGDFVFDQTAVEDRVAFDEPDFTPVSWLFNYDTKTALARNAAGDLVFVIGHGDGLVSRRLASGAVNTEYKDGRLIIARPDHVSRPVHFVLPENEALAWLGTDAEAKKNFSNLN